MGVWQALEAGGAEADPLKQDPYLAIASANGFADQGGPSADGLWPVLLQVRSLSNCPQPAADLLVHSGHMGSRHLTARASLDAIARLQQDPGVERVLLAAPQVPRRAWPTAESAPIAGLEAHLAQARPTVPPSLADARTSDALLGVIDDGCPFAHPELQRADGGLRLRHLWNQDRTVRGSTPPGFDYGQAFSYLDLSATRDASRGSGAVDPWACQALTGQPKRSAYTHGAHVLGLLANGRHVLDAGRDALRGREPAHRGQGHRPDLAFVQLPQAVLRSVSVAALELHAYDGVRHLCNLAVEQGYRRVVIVLAYESWQGPHDGSSWFEQALDELVDHFKDGNQASLQVDIVLPADNGRERRTHAHIAHARTEDQLQWHVPPGNEDPTWLEIWAPPGGPNGLELQVLPPGGEASPWFSWGQAGQWSAPDGRRSASPPFASLVMHPRSPQSANPDGRAQALLRISPTVAREGSGAPHGIWHIRLRGPTGALSDLHARLGRVEPGTPVPRRNHQPQFVGRNASSLNDDRLHTLNGHAGGKRVVVVGAALAKDHAHASLPLTDGRGQSRRYRAKGASERIALQGASTAYSGSGPTEGSRLRPDASVQVDKTARWPGVLGLGMTAAAAVRLTGTSAATPLHARRRANTPKGASTIVGPPLPQTRDDPALGFSSGPD